MGIVTNYLIDLVHKSLNTHGVVIWYDPEKQYQNVADKIKYDVHVFFYEGSYFEIRYKLEPFLDAREREKVLVYIQEEHDETASPLIEAESFGTFIKPGGPTGRNTRLEIIAKNALVNVIKPENFIEIEEIIKKGKYSLYDLDKLAEKSEEITKPGMVSLIFNTSDSLDIALQFLSSDANDQKIEEKDALKEMMLLIESHFGFEGSAGEVKEYRELLIRYSLISEFTGSLPEGVKISSLDSVPKAQKKAHIDECEKLVMTWRNRSDLLDNYVIAAEKVEKDYDIASIKIPPESLFDVETFPWFEKALITHSFDLVIKGEFLKAKEIAESRIQKFWSKVDYKNSRILWKIISTSALLNKIAKDIQNEISVPSIGAKEIIERYSDHTNPTAWYRLDFLHRHLEKNYSDYDKAAIDDVPDLDLMITRANQTYYNTINRIAETFSDALIKDKFKLNGLMNQRQIFSKIVEPRLSQGKTAYFLVDALRYELAVDLYESLKVKDKKIEFAVATPPTITPIGMAALMPGANENFGIDVTISPPAVMINDNVLKIREDRIKYLEKASSVNVVSFKLGALPKDSKDLKEKMEKADLILITTQEIDFHNIEGNKDLVQKLISDILEQIITAIKKLRDYGVWNIVITSDHGHLFGEEIGTEMRIDPPDGETMLLERRCWVGRGGIDSDSFFRVKPQVFEIDGDFELAFPKNIAGFKVRGGGLSFLHGGLSPQEFIIPVIELETEAPKIETTGKGLKFSLRYGKDKITSRFFTVEAEYTWKEVLVGPENYRVHFELRVDNKKGKVVSASPEHEFDDITGDLILKKSETCHVTLMLPEEYKKGNVSLHMLDAETSKELASIENIEVSLMI